MNQLIITIKTALFDFSRNKGRTFLTSLGILIGVMAVVLLTALGLGLKAYIEQQFESLGSNLITVVPGKVIQGGSFSAGSSSFGSIQFDEQDYQSLSRIRYLKSVVPMYTRSFTVTGIDKSMYAELYGTSADVFQTWNLKTEYGRAFRSSDVEKRSKVVVIGSKVAEEVYGSGRKALGRDIKVENQSFTIIGVLESKGGGPAGRDFNNALYMPYKTAYIFNTDKKFIAFYLQAKSEDVVEKAKLEIEKTMLKSYEEDDFSVLEPSDLIGAITSIFAMLNMALVGIAAISLIVGGIGIMNIMYVTVTERIKEIGIRRALGARKNDILIQFLVESVILSLFGGVSGLLLSYLIVLLVQPYFPAYIDTSSVLLGLGVSSAIGIIFGVFPAKKAADLSPIEAIRYE